MARFNQLVDKGASSADLINYANVLGAFAARGERPESFNGYNASILQKARRDLRARVLVVAG